MQYAQCLICYFNSQLTIYQSNKSIFVRSIDNPAISRQYTSHTTSTTVARFSPSGFYVASGDISGTVRVWDCVGEGSTKGDYHIIAGRINDIAWDGDSARIIAVGEGKERMGHCITWDSGNTVGEISGHSSQINTVAIRQQRPLRAVTGSDDANLAFYHGAPFKFQSLLKGNHERFVFGTQFSPDGATLVSVGADRRIWLYDGKTGEQKAQIGEGVHTGSIFGVSWASDSKRLVTASADQTVRLWDVEAGKAVTTWRMGEEGVVSIPDQQVGITWPSGRSDGLVISVDLDGNLNYLVEGKSTPTKVIRGHQKNVTASEISADTFFTGSADGRVRAWNVSTGIAEDIDGDRHTNYIAALAADPKSDRVYSVGWDDTLRCISAKTFTGTTSSLSSQPKDVTVSASGATYVATAESIEIFLNGEKSASLPVKGATCVAASGDTLAVGHDDHSISLYTTASGNTPTPIPSSLRKPAGTITALAFSPHGKYLAAGASNGKILVFSTSGEWSVVTDRWSAHTSRVTAIAWDATGECAVSGSLDTNVYVWSVAEPARRIKALNAHKEGVNGVAWAGKGKVLSTGADGSVKVWGVVGL
jgi:WD40 repeat protein